MIPVFVKMGLSETHLCERAVAMLSIQKVGCNKEPGKQRPMGKKEHSFTRDMGTDVIFQFQMP